MSLLTFQRALADFAASPDLCRAAIADPVPVLRSYELSSRERLRLASMVRDRLMATNCVLYRVNRVTPIYVFFPMTCQVLGRELRRELETFWSTHRGTDLQYFPETERFVRFLKQRVCTGALQNEFVEEIVEYEAAAMELRFASSESDSLIREVRFVHDPACLLNLLAESAMLPVDLPRGEYRVIIDARDGEMTVRLASTSLGLEGKTAGPVDRLR